VCTNSAEQHGFCTAKILTLEEFIIMLWGSAIEVPLYFIVPSNYISDIGAESVVLEISVGNIGSTDGMPLVCHLVTSLVM
jgi:hypothetical protein